MVLLSWRAAREPEPELIQCGEVVGRLPRCAERAGAEGEPAIRGLWEVQCVTAFVMRGNSL